MQCLTLWGAPQHVSTAHGILKLLCELSHNKSQRIQVPSLNLSIASFSSAAFYTYAFPCSLTYPRPTEYCCSRRSPGATPLLICPPCDHSSHLLCSCVCTYAQQLSAYTLPPGSLDAWKIRFKGIMHVLTCLTRAYSGM